MIPRTLDPRRFASPELCRLEQRQPRPGLGFIALIARVWLAQGEPRVPLESAAAARSLTPAVLRAMVQRELRFREDAARWERRVMAEGAAEAWLEAGERTRAERTAYVRAAGLSRGEFTCALERVKLAKVYGWKLTGLERGGAKLWL